MNDIYYLILICCIILSSNYATFKIGEQHYNSTKKLTLFDIFHTILPDLHAYHYLIDVIVLGAIISLFFVSNKSLTTEFLAKFLIIMLIRSFTIVSTILPKHEICEDKFSIREFFLGGCYDKIFSGHTSFLLLLTLLYYREDIIGILPLIAINIINILFILATRSHYTVDIILAIFVTTTIYSIKI
jgi:hypothetical protein